MKEISFVVVLLIIVFSFALLVCVAQGTRNRERGDVCEALGYIKYAALGDACLQEEGVMKIYVDYEFVLERLSSTNVALER